MDAAAAHTDREEKLNDIYNEIETNLKLIGNGRIFNIYIYRSMKNNKYFEILSVNRHYCYRR